MARPKQKPENQLPKITKPSSGLIERPQNKIELPEYGELISSMQNEAAAMWTDYVRGYVGSMSPNNPIPGTGIYINFDRVLKLQQWKELAWYDMYAEVERETHIRSILDSSKINVVEMDWDVYPYIAHGKKKEKATTQNQKIADFIKRMLDGITFFPQHMFNLMGALGMGYAVSEILWKIKNNEVSIDNILNRPQRRFQFDAVTRDLKLRNLQAPYYGIALPKNKFIVHRCSAQWDNPFGDALDQSLYWMWLFKKDVLRFYAHHLEVGAASVPIVTHPNKADDKLKTEALAVAKMIRQGGYGRLPESFKVIWAEAKNAIQNAEAYDRFVQLCNDEMSMCVNGQTLTEAASSRAGKGTMALGKEHRLTQNSRDVYRAKGLCATLNATIIKWAVDFNFANVEGYPIFKPDLEEADDLVKESEIVKNVSGAGYDFDETELSEKFGYTITKKQPMKLGTGSPALSQKKVDE